MDSTKTFVITGAGSGLGYHTALGLAKTGAKIILICRDAETGEKAKNSIINYSGNNSVYIFTADLSSQTQIRSVALQIRELFPVIDVLINNAACSFSKLSYSEDNIEMQFAVNHLAPFMLTLLLLGPIKQAKQGRIITVSSRAHSRAKLYLDDLNLSKKYSPFAAYNQSKLANILFTYELARKLQHTSITANTLHPGLVDTPIGNKHTTRFHSLLWSAIRLLGSQPAEAAKTSIYLAISPEVAKTSGQYFANCKPIKSSPTSYDPEIAKQLWDISEQLTGVKFPNEIGV